MNIFAFVVIWEGAGYSDFELLKITGYLWLGFRLLISIYRYQL